MSRSGGYKCYNIHCNSCIGKTLCGEPEDKALGCDNRILTHKTNGDRIRSMSDEELADWLNYYAHDEYINPPCGWFEWLKQTAEDG